MLHIAYTVCTNVSYSLRYIELGPRRILYMASYRPLGLRVAMNYKQKCYLKIIARGFDLRFQPVDCILLLINAQ